MPWQELLDPEVQKFINDHENENIRDLALKKFPDDAWNAPLILDQIKVRQKAKLKTPKIYETNGFIFPKINLYEQVSSEACAAYKASITSGNSFIDLTAGGGIDAFYISKHFVSGQLIETDEETCALLSHNFMTLETQCDVTVAHARAEDAIRSAKPIDFVYIDPQRREKGRKGLYSFDECSPNIIEMLTTLKIKTKTVMIKASPVLDIERAINDLQHVTEVHVVQWNNECKEVLYLLNFAQHTNPSDVKIHALEINDQGRPIKKFTYSMQTEKDSKCSYAMPKAGQYIYEPGPAFLKTGGFKSIAHFYQLEKIHPHSHLYIADSIKEGFPGKHYEILDILPVKTKRFPIKKADLCIRNFPSTVEALRKKLNIADGGEHRIYATTLKDESKKIIVCKKQPVK